MRPRLVGSSDELPAPIAAISVHGDSVTTILQRRPPDGSAPDTNWLARHDIRRTSTTLLRESSRTLRSVAMGPSGSVVTVEASRWGGPGTVSVWRDEEPDPAATLTDARDVRSVSWFHDGRLLLGFLDQAWTDDAGPKAELWDSDLTAVEDRLRVNDAGFELASAHGIVACTGIDLHLWCPGSDRQTFSLHNQEWGPPGEMGPCAVSEDANRVAVAHDRWRETEDQVWVLDVDDPRSYKVIRDPTTKGVSHVALSSDGQLAAVRIQETDHLRVYDLERVELVADWEVRGVEVIAFQGQRRLVVGGAELTTWEM